MLEDSFGAGADLFELGTQAPFMQFAYWARYLGYATHVRIRGGRTGFAPDPTDAVSRFVSTRCIAGQEFPIRDFADKLADFSAVIDGGATRAVIESAMPPAARTDRTSALSRSLSYALACLEDAREIKLHSRADAQQLAVVVGDTRRSCTHVSIGDRNA
jgi:hypothetical protein